MAGFSPFSVPSAGVCARRPLFPLVNRFSARRTFVYVWLWPAVVCIVVLGLRRRLLGVKCWVTLNEPGFLVFLTYRQGKYPPCRCSSKFGNCSEGDSDKEPFVAAHNMILSHSAAVDIYRNKYQIEQRAQIDIVLHIDWFEPLSNSTADKLATKRAQAFTTNWILDPILFGKYPKEMEMVLETNLPEFSSKDKAKPKRGVDFIGLNHHASHYVRYCISSVCESVLGVSATEGSYQLTTLKIGVPIGELVNGNSSVIVTKFDDFIQLPIDLQWAIANQLELRTELPDHGK
ncbi:hypothetical protein RJT34_12139 [Clitoria ternatea]|uniref:Uncharacterized protein n=1 Tax=Clitoria ternatea TaxID=43366 RepID=A0AAN9PKD8_CLITE